MKGSIIKRGNKYSIVIDAPKKEDGKRNQVWISGFDKKPDAEKALPRILVEIMDGKFVDPDKITLREYLDLYLKDHAKQNLAATTYQKYYYASKKVKGVIGDYKIQELRPRHIQRFVNELNENNAERSTISSYIAALKAAFNQAIKWQIVNNNPCCGVSMPKSTSVKLNILMPNQMQDLLSVSKDHVLYPVILLGLMCGMRRGEILGLTWKDIDLSIGKIYIQNSMVQAGEDIIYKDTKTSSGRRQIDISKKLTNFLISTKQKQLENKSLFGNKYIDNDFVCKRMDGSLFRPDYIPKAFKKLLREAGLPEISFHDLRHTHASMLLLAGENPKVVQERLGHSSIQVTLDTYSHLMPSMQKSAAEKAEGQVDF